MEMKIPSGSGMTQEEYKLVPIDGASVYIFGYDVAISGDTAIIGSPYNDDMGSHSGYVYVFIIRYKGTWEEVHKITPANGEASDYFGWSVAISGNTDVIGARFDNERGRYGGSGYVYTKIDGKWTEDVNTLPENGAATEKFGYSVAISGSTALFGAPLAGEENGGTAYIVDDLFVPC